MRLLIGMLAVMAVLLLACSSSEITGIGSGADVVKGSGCTDTDGSNDPKIGGQVNGVWDQCMGDAWLIEQYCEDGRPSTQNYHCENVCDPVDHQCY